MRIGFICAIATKILELDNEFYKNLGEGCLSNYTELAEASDIIQDKLIVYILTYL